MQRPGNFYDYYPVSEDPDEAREILNLINNVIRPQTVRQNQSPEPKLELAEVHQLFPNQPDRVERTLGYEAIVHAA